MPDLTYARETVAKLMEATCVISRPGDRSESDVVDEVTLEVVSGADPPTVYTGPCTAIASGDGTAVVHIPWDAAEVKEDDLVAVTASTQDSLLVGRRLKVTGVNRSSFVVWRRLECADVTPGRF